ncbi:MAG: hypothetical protein QNJ31_04915 [Candidatus Caenarcaniphilales bacterium]|nr:hypothetical protein [Candidatus Caenarcaniphilales bacterium]
MISSGINVGDGSIIAAGAVVVKDVEPYSIVGGIPAKHIRYRFDERIREQLLELRWWEYPIESLNGINFSDINQAISQLQSLHS